MRFRKPAKSCARRTTPHLPYEIWAYIASFVPKAKLMRLYSVHQAFFDLAMKTIYSEVRIYHAGDESTHRCLQSMGPCAATYIRTLTLRPHIFGEADHVNSFRNSKTFSLLSKIASMGRRKFSSESLRSTEILLRGITQMTNLRSLIVGCYPCDDWLSFNKSVAFLDMAWIHGSQFRNLKLDVPLENMERILLTIPHFPVLEDLSISIRIETTSFIHNNTISKVSAFINQQSSTLIRLAIDIPTLKVDQTLFFYGLGHLPKLIAVSIGQPIERLQPQPEGALDSFLVRHALAIRELRLYFHGPTDTHERPSPNAFFSSSIFRHDFPSLRVLDLGLSYWDHESQFSLARNLAQYLNKFRCTLTSLIISDYVLCQPIVQELVSTLGGKDMILQSLKIHVHYLTCDLLDLLALQLPHLSELDLDFNCLRYKNEGDQHIIHHLRSYNDAADFVRNMKKCLYKDWALRHLTVHPLYDCCGKWEECRPLLVASLPGARTFNGLPAKYFIQVPDYTNYSTME